MSDVELAMNRCKEIETLLVERFGANGRGLHEKLSSVENLLAPHIVKQGRYIATIRNKIAHEASYRNLDDRDRFIRACDEVEAALRNDRPGTQTNFDRERQFTIDTNSYFKSVANRAAIPRNFVFYFEKSDRGIKILTRKGRFVSIFLSGIIHAYVLFIVVALPLTFTKNLLSSNHFLEISFIGALFVFFKTFIFIKSRFINITVTSSHIHVGKRKYERRGETIFYNYSKDVSKRLSWQVYFIYPNKKVYLAHHLTRLESEELINILCNADRIYSEPQVSFAMRRKDGLIFLSSTKTNTSFVIDYNEGIWQGLRCRMKVKGQVELTKSELTEIYNKRLQTLS